MSTNYNGLPANLINIIPPPLGTLTITSATLASPIVITTSVPHNYAEGQYVNVYAVTVNTAANGQWPVHILSPTTFSLTGSSGNGVGTSGNCISCALPLFPLPSDGDLEDAASVNVTFEQVVDALSLIWLQMNWNPQLQVGGFFPIRGIVDFGGSSVTRLDTGAIWNFNAGSIPTVSTTWTFDATSTAVFASGSFISGLPTLKAASNFFVASTAQITIQSGGIFNAQAGSASTFAGSASFIAGSVTRFFDSTTMMGSTNLLLDTRFLARSLELTPFAPTSGGTNVWAIAGDGTAIVTGAVNPLGSNVAALSIPIHVPNGCTLTSVRVVIDGASGHSAFPGGKPASMPTLAVFRSQAGTSTQIGTTTTDASSTAPNFETQHTLIVTTSAVIDRTANRYFAILTSEFGTNALVGDRFIEAFAFYTPDHYDED